MTVPSQVQISSSLEIGLHNAAPLDQPTATDLVRNFSRHEPRKPRSAACESTWSQNVAQLGSVPPVKRSLIAYHHV